MGDKIVCPGLIVKCLKPRKVSCFVPAEKLI